MGTRNGLLSVYVPSTKGIIETYQCSFYATIKYHNVMNNLEINEPDIISFNKVPTWQLTPTVDTHEKLASGYNEVQTVILTD